MHETTTFLLVFTDFKIFFTGRLINKPFLIWLLTIAPNLKYVTTVPCNLSLIVSFLTLMFHKVVWQHVQGMVGFLISFLLLITRESACEGIFENRLGFDGDITMSMVSPFSPHDAMHPRY